jgi:hypothetical protein
MTYYRSPAEFEITSPVMRLAAAEQAARDARFSSRRSERAALRWHRGTLFGICFLSHQIGSFLGAWSGSYIFGATGSYSLIWTTTAAAGLLAATLHFPINDAAVNDRPFAA